MKLALITGQRIGEVTRIARHDLQLDGDAPVWVIPSAKTRNGEGHRVPLSRLARSLIHDALALASQQVPKTPWFKDAGRDEDVAVMQGVGDLRQSGVGAVCEVCRCRPGPSWRVPGRDDRDASDA
jgi:integrase